MTLHLRTWSNPRPPRRSLPHLWYGVWSGNDSCNTPENTNPGGAADQPYFCGTDFPVLNFHAHACFLYSASKLLGIDFHSEGFALTLRLPKDQFRFESPLLGVSKTRSPAETRFEGWYHPAHAGTWTVRLSLEKQDINALTLAEVNGHRIHPHPTPHGSITLHGESTATTPLRWFFRCAHPQT